MFVGHGRQKDNLASPEYQLEETLSARYVWIRPFGMMQRVFALHLQ